MASAVKSVSFTIEEQQKGGLLEYAENKGKENGSFSEYVKKLIRNDKEQGFKFNEEQEKAIIKLIKKYAPTVKEEDIKFDDDKVDFLGQF